MSSSTIAAAAAAQTPRPFNASEVTKWLNGRFNAIESEAMNPSLPPEARPEILKVPKPAGGNATGAAGGAGAWGGGKKQGNNFVSDVLKAVQAGGATGTSTPASADKK